MEIPPDTLEDFLTTTERVKKDFLTKTARLKNK
jgi:hypothetical protein